MIPKFRKLYPNMAVEYKKVGDGFLKPNYPHINATNRSPKRLPDYRGEFEDSEGKLYSLGGWCRENGQIEIVLSLIVPKQIESTKNG